MKCNEAVVHNVIIEIPSYVFINRDTAQLCASIIHILYCQKAIYPSICFERKTKNVANNIVLTYADYKKCFHSTETLVSNLSSFSRC